MMVYMLPNPSYTHTPLPPSLSHTQILNIGVTPSTFFVTYPFQIDFKRKSEITDLEIGLIVCYILSVPMFYIIEIIYL